MIENILGNKTSIAILRLMTRFNSNPFTIGEISAATDAGARNINDSLKNLTYEGIITQETKNGKAYYKFTPDNKTKEIIEILFEEERRRIFLNKTYIYKTLSEIELKAIKSIGKNLIDTILFGSFAKGTAIENSDIDICLLVEKKTDKDIRKFQENIENLKTGKEIQTQVFTLSEFIKAKNKKNPLIMNILREGLSLRLSR